MVLSPSSTLVRIPCAPTFLLSLSLSSSYNSQFSRKWSTVSFPAPHSHSEVSMILKRRRYSFKWQCPVRNLEIHTTCSRCCRALYSLSPVVVPGCWLKFRRRFAVCLPVFHSVSHLVFIVVWTDLFWADLILMLGITVLFGVAAAFAAWSACSFPSMFLWPGTHSMCMLQVNLIA